MIGLAVRYALVSPVTVIIFLSDLVKTAQSLCKFKNSKIQFTKLISSCTICIYRIFLLHKPWQLGTYCLRTRRHLSHKTVSLCCNIYFLAIAYCVLHTIITAIIIIIIITMIIINSIFIFIFIIIAHNIITCYGNYHIDVDDGDGDGDGDGDVDVDVDVDGDGVVVVDAGVVVVDADAAVVVAGA